MFSTALHLLIYSLAGNLNFARKEELKYETIYRSPYLQYQPTWVRAHAKFYQMTFMAFSFSFSYSSNFLFSTIPDMQYQISFSLFDTFSHLRNLNQCVHRGVTIPQGQQHV